MNSFNVSTMGGKVSKTFVKIEGVTGKKADILFMCDCRMGRKAKEVEKMFNLSRNGKYKMYINSNAESRGVAIAIKASIYHVVNNIFKDDDGNVISMEVKIQDTVINLVCVYGPNSNDLEFFRGLKARYDYNGCPTIMGGDFNTVIDNRGGDLSIDRLGEGACPNLQNSRFLNSIQFNSKKLYLVIMTMLHGYMQTYSSLFSDTKKNHNHYSKNRRRKK